MKMVSKISGAEAFVECLRKENVEVIFGIPGGSLLPIHDELYDSSIRHILVRHEQCAAHMADGYARATGRTGVCMATSGPGATNLVTGIANAYMDSVPMVAFTGQVPTSMIGNDAFQEADITGITLPITKINYLIKNANHLPKTIREAFCIASTGRPGPVLVDIPKDVQITEIEFEYPKTFDLRGYKPTIEGHPLQIKRAIKAITDAERPIVYAGGGVIISNASEELRALAELTLTPVMTTLLGKGAFPENHPLSLGMVGMHGTKYANYAMTETDLIIAVGARFDDRVTGKLDAFAPNAKVIHIDIDPAEISKSVSVTIPIVGDAKSVLKEMIKGLREKPRIEWLKKIEEWKTEFPLRYDRSGKTLKPQFIIEQIHELCPDAIIATEVGQCQMWAAQYFKCTKPRSFISSGGLGTMGYGFPAAIGAKVGCPDKTVIDIAGDGSFQMTCQELATAVLNDVPVTVAILNNGFLGMVRQWQELFYDKRYAATYLGASPDFTKLAEAYGALGIEVRKPSEVKSAIEEAVTSDKPAVIDFKIDPEENVLPMVPAGAAINEIIDYEG
ncbi:MAG: acetolactate synthase large subunit [Methanocellales archaeon]|nr:acetolactate synthase large subunit [Methanocellales archaeon]MDD5235361.1 acetolactate synthase large subunit [Methanocellales archaeon]